MTEPTNQPEPVKMKSCWDCGQEIAESEKVCPKCQADFEELDEELKHLEKLNRIADARKPKPAPAPAPTPTTKKKSGGFFKSLARKKEKK